ncbi:arylamine N-acetyltransferase, pineal gland isozyme NAT-10-like [Micropterus salmoides]|uniref:arylamine N-acetyltransferase, pineal gland isozyme NAT-10-like n=1 Tax=Micropterus salmoides TaxID=27706 RepID=UPI0018EAF880|nr:arylamine N-acetyltransferase, pineal gland isozyme NAT-10-like [Micropterus salmoides]XP_045922146.1 arylamine N-acetyltransferase, pineal gland isozyme NAT-10-like [Micropterus dolomieu]
MDVQTYLSRIGFAGPAEPSLDVLRSVHTCHLLSVPFENLTVHSGGRVHRDPALLYDKIVNRRRGGFCFENNGLFSWLLSQLGFQVTLLSAQVKNLITGYYGPPFDHLILMVSLEGRRWLCDVGVGVPGFSAPLSLETSGPQEQGHRVYRIRKDTGMCFLEWQREENRGPDGDWTELYKFTLEPRYLEDFEEMCQYHQSSPCSIFFCKSLCTVLKPGGRLTYIGRRLISTTFPTEETGGALETTTRELRDEDIPGVLAEKFGVVLDSPLIPKDEAITPPPVMY